MAHFGRRTLYLYGQALTFLFVLLIGILACIPQHYSSIPVRPRSAVGGVTGGPVNHHPTTLNWTIAALLLAFTLTYDATLGPICYSLVSEIPSTRLRSKTIVLARNCYNISGIITNVITPRMLNPTAWGWGAKAGFFWAGTAVVGILWSWWRLPEPKGRTFGEMDELFERRINARRFEGYFARMEERKA
jgi:SP family general alpha glucoside:H+ symporter-like MFS transporter